MQLMQRLGANGTDKYYEEYLDLLLKNPGCCDNVWLPTLYGYPKLEKHRKMADHWKVAAEKFRKNGISVSLQLSNSLGHGQYASSGDFSGINFEGSPVQHMIGHNGIEAGYCFCPRGQFVRDYIKEEVSYYAEIKPDVVWVDDDIRMSNHLPVDFGCFCDNCIRDFNKQFGSSFTRETLVKEILHGEDLKWRENFITFLREGLYDLMYMIGDTIHKISPDTALGLQYCPHGAYTGYGYDYLFKAMMDSTGKIPLSRSGDGSYNDHDPNTFINKALKINWMNSILPDYVKCKCPEIENLPHVMFGKSPAGTAFETSYYFANGNTDMSYSMMMAVNEPLDFYDSEFALFSKHRKYWDRLSDYNKVSHQSGLQFFMSKKMWQKKLDPDADMSEFNNEHYEKSQSILRNAIPVAYDNDDTTLYLLHAEIAKMMSLDEAKYLLTKNVVCDGESIEILTNRGIDCGIKAHRVEFLDTFKIAEKFTDHPANTKPGGNFKMSGLLPHRSVYHSLEKGSAEIEIIGEYVPTAAVGVTVTPYGNDPAYPYGLAEAIVHTKEGGKWAVLGYAPWKGVIPSYKRDQMLNLADYISNNGLCARLLTAFPAVLLPRKHNENGKTVSVSLTNCTVGESGELELLIRNPIGENFTFMSQYNGEKKLDYVKNGNDYIVKVPSINAWSVATVFID